MWSYGLIEVLSQFLLEGLRKPMKRLCPDWATQTCLGVWDDCSPITLCYLATGFPWIVCMVVGMRCHTYTRAHAQTHMHGGTGLHLTVIGKSPHNSAWWQFSQLLAVEVCTSASSLPYTQSFAFLPPSLPPSPPFITLCHLILIRLDIAFTKELDIWLVVMWGT